MKKTVLFIFSIVFSISLSAKEESIKITNTDELSKYLIKNIDSNVINNNSITLQEAREKKDKINSQFEKESAQYRSNLLRYTIELSYLERSLAEKKSEKEELVSLLKTKKSKFEQIQQEIQNENYYIRKLSEMLKKDINFNNNLSTQGYFITIAKGRLSDTRDNLISKAVTQISNEAIPTLNGVLVETVLKYDQKLSQSIKETSSGKAITDSSDTTLKIFFTDENRNNVLIYGTKVDVYPFEIDEKREHVYTRNRKTQNNLQQIYFVKDRLKLNELIGNIENRYSSLNTSSAKKKILASLEAIQKHNSKSLKIINELNETYKNSLAKITKRIKNREINLELLNKQKSIFHNEISEIEKEVQAVSLDISTQEIEFETQKRRLKKYKNSYTFSRAEMYNRRFSNSVKEIKNIISDIVLELDKAFSVTSSKIETLYNSSKILKDLIHEVRYQKTYVYANVIPYFVPLDNQIGAVVILKAQFTEDKNPNSDTQKSNSDDKFGKFIHIHLPDQNDKKEIEERDILIPQMKKITSGSFTIGSPNGDGDERWQKEITIKNDFFIGKYEITIREYEEFTNSVKDHYPIWEQENSVFNIFTGLNNDFKNMCLDDKCPIIGVSWDDAKAYVQWLSAKTGEKYRLPTEAEWEYVAKAGSANLEYGFFSGNLKEHAWFSENSENSTQPVGLKRPNIWGIHDINGNVWEWCEDDYRNSYKLTPSNGLSYKNDSNEKIVRGGSWNATDYFIRSSNRNWSNRESVLYNLGFRIVKEID